MMIKLLLICLIACISQTKWLRYTDADNKFTINYPNNWTKNNNINAIVFLSSKESEKDMFQENVNIMLQDLSKQPMSLEQYTELTKKQVSNNLGTSAILSLKNVTIAGQKGKEFVYDMSYQGKSLKIKQYWFIKGDIAYLFSFTAEQSQYDKYESTAAEMIKSFEFF